MNCTQQSPTTFAYEPSVYTESALSRWQSTQSGLGQQQTRTSQQEHEFAAGSPIEADTAASSTLSHKSIPLEPNTDSQLPHSPTDSSYPTPSHCNNRDDAATSFVKKYHFMQQQTSQQKFASSSSCHDSSWTSASNSATSPSHLQIAFHLFDTGKYADAFHYLVACHLKDASNPEILHRLGYISCLMKNYRASFDFYFRAATEGRKASSYNNIGILFSKGLGVEQNKEKALQCFLKAFELGDKGAAVNIGNMFKRGEGIQQDYRRAIHWYRKALGHAGSYLSLGLMFYYGFGVEKDVQKALHYFQQELSVSGQCATTLSFMDYAKNCIVEEQCCIGRT